MSEKPVLTWREMRSISGRFLPYARRYWHYFLAGILATIVLNAAGVAQPYVLKVLTDRVLSRPGGDMHILEICLLALVASAVVKGSFLYVQAYMMALGNNSTIRDIRQDVYRHLQMLPLTWFDEARLGDIIVRLTDDVRQVTELLAAGIILFMNDLLVSLGAITYMLVKDWKMTLLAFFLSPVTARLIGGFDQRVEQLVVAAQEKFAALTSHVQETVAGIRVVKAFSREDREASRYHALSTDSYELSMRMQRLMLVHNPVVESISTVSIVVVIGFGSWQVSHHAMTIGDFLAFFGYILLASTPVTRLTQTIANLRRGFLAARRIFEIQDTQCEVHDAADAAVLPPLQTAIELDGVTFGYRPSHPVLRNVSARIDHGQVVAVVGPNGAGKSTLVALLGRFYDPQQGSIRVDGHDLRTVRLDSLRPQIAFVPQENVLFSGSIRDNLKYGRPAASDEEMIAAARAAHCHDFICALPGGYDAVLEERGKDLSGGQRQRIAIARALLTDPRLLILDEATASLDLESERLIGDALEHLLQGRTTVIIAHRLSTVERADKILVLEDGCLVEQGTHASLLERNGLYRRLHDSFSGSQALPGPELAGLGASAS